MEMSSLISAPLDLLVLHATNREPVVLVVVVQVRVVVAVVQAHEVRAVATVLCRVATVLCRTPEVRVVALVVVIPVAVPAAGRERREAEGVRAVAAVIPSGRGLEGRTGCGLAAHCREQGFPFRCIRQVPAARARRFRRTPRVKAAVLGAVGGVVVVAVAVRGFVVEVLRHPGLRADGHRLVRLAVAGVGKRLFGKLRALAR